ncbi:glutathione S-transferase family protein [Neiella sp. HB171785]|uniref:Glutathione S-transferase family protein n=1 Tax=Neiella litorisoli TaxID=2771431 RepID=A0A8J6QIC5_9GAMM|nr:glutathione S-transferase family protein [Neiella litorisoli]MBD1389097.1 glutathione S-transferase family protein [Neiella litorisoli]
MIVYGDTASGNCYKIKLLLSFLNIEHEWRHVDILAGECQRPAFKQLNPNGKIPLLQLASGETLSESNAILNYLAEGTEWLPQQPWLRAKVLQWQFFEQYSHEPFIAVARYIAVYLGLPAERKAEYDSKQLGGHKALAVMEQQLSQTNYLVGSGATIADISLYGYTHVADEGGFDLSGYPAITDWLQRITEIAGYIPMKDNEL